MKDSAMILESFSTPIGDMQAVTTDNGVAYLGFAGQKKSQQQLQSLMQRHEQKQTRQNSHYQEQLQMQLAEYFSGLRKDFSIALDVESTKFRHKVWQVLRQIPYGKTWSYREQAELIGNKNAFRAVASANANNPVSILVPCHRVIASNGEMAGYAGGIERKQQLLNLEFSYS